LPTDKTAPLGIPVSLALDVDDVAMIRVLGVHDRVLAEVEREFPDLTIHARGNRITIEGDRSRAEEAMSVVEELISLAKTGVQLSNSEVVQTARIARESDHEASRVLGQPIVSRGGRTIRPKTLGQARYVESIDHNTIVFGIGPAGTGKTYLAMAKAVAALERKEVDRIILTRPAVEAGERLGFLPGTLSEKIDPYLRPLFDALHEMMNPELVPKLLASGTVEVAPLAYMRGRTLNNSFIVLDEAQNTTPEQMKMFLTRLGFDSKRSLPATSLKSMFPEATRACARWSIFWRALTELVFSALAPTTSSATS